MANPLILAADMMRRRDDVKRLLAGGYDKTIGKAKEIIKARCREQGESVLDAALGICLACKAANPVRGGDAAQFIIAAAVDLCEEGWSEKGAAHAD